MRILNEVTSLGEVYSTPRVIDYLTKLQFWYAGLRYPRELITVLSVSWLLLTDNNTDCFMAVA